MIFVEVTKAGAKSTVKVKHGEGRAGAETIHVLGPMTWGTAQNVAAVIRGAYHRGRNDQEAETRAAG